MRNNYPALKAPLPSPSTLLAFTLGALLFGSHFGFGFTEPSSIPPFDNVPAPLNVSSTGQSKAGGLILNTGGAANGLIVQLGNVGIGTSNPSRTLDVQGSNANPIAVFNQIGSGDIVNFLDSGISKFIIKKGGNVGIGMESPVVKLDVSGGIRPGNQTIAVTCDAATAGTQRYNTTAKLMEFCDGTSWKSFSTSLMKICSENDNCIANTSATALLCGGVSPDSYGTMYSGTGVYTISYGAWSNGQCGTSGTGWHVDKFSSCSTGAGTKIAACQWVMVQ